VRYHVPAMRNHIGRTSRLLCAVIYIICTIEKLVERHVIPREFFNIIISSSLSFLRPPHLLLQ
jgi:hypothetical protein